MCIRDRFSGLQKGFLVEIFRVGPVGGQPAAKAVDGRAMQANEFVQFLYIQCCFILCSNERIFRGESLHSLYGRGKGGGSNFAKILRIPQLAWCL